MLPDNVGSASAMDYDASFDLIFHPASNVFVSNLQPVWRECHRVVRPCIATRALRP